MKIALDAMGGDNAPLSNIQGAFEAINAMDVEVILLGDENIIKKHLEKENIDTPKITIKHCEEMISNDEKPVKAVRTKKNSSLVVGLNLLKNKEVDAFVSAGSTGAILAGGLFVLGRIKGIDRPALTGVYPNESGGSVLLDIGANADCKPKNLDQFALMGSIYASSILNISNPKVGLINIGAEEEKGSDLYKSSFELMKNNAEYNFVGNIEARDIPKGTVDVMVCDGFTGNIILKLTEGVASTIFGLIKKTIMSSLKSKIGGIMLKNSFGELKKSLDSDEYGGAPLLGVNGIVIKAHGSSEGKAIKNAIKQAKTFYDSKSIEKIISYAEKNNKVSEEKSI
ncbi:glycerol-3-phosphate acyltransferase PlsX [Acetoanaerobium pronyense]|uniref:Phosphate acyltransferase n=1 Tax=Acetoanaerobium pronyense TaxID=1482736 RepID=A0ABS4KJR6_9FIRM|nr:phosphate acyltransferase PlsX [Acetoanaerobium pronyense]MBP2027585.1 glycerol-3-phosphate acyltransferase PlsX [Acetoanaerobium pronyense]